MTIDYYDQNARAFFDGTVSVDMNLLYDHFVPRLQSGSIVLDAGCGSGRDSLYFMRQGLQVVAMDASQEMARLATELTGLPVQVCRFDEFRSDILFDGIWACASLLHVPMVELPGVIGHLFTLLRPQGIIYCSFKYGEGELIRDGRTFTNLNEVSLELLVKELPVEIVEIWKTEDLRINRQKEVWLNAVLRFSKDK